MHKQLCHKLFLPLRLSVPRISAPRLPEGELVDLDDITRKRREKDLVELQSLIAKHFEQRQKDEDELMLLQDRIEQRKAARVEQTQIRQAKEKKRMEQERVSFSEIRCFLSSK